MICTGPCKRDLPATTDYYYKGRQRCKQCYNRAGVIQKGYKPRFTLDVEPVPDGLEQYRNPDGTLIRELRLPEEVFAPESLATPDAFDRAPGDGGSPVDAAAAARAEARAAKLAEVEAQRARDAQRRRDSDYSTLTQDDLAGEYDVGVGNVPGQGANSAQYGRERAQLFNAQMGVVAEHLLDAAERAPAMGVERALDAAMTAEDGVFIGAVSEQERRYGNKRVARAVAIWLAAEALQVRMFKTAAQRYMSDKVQATGYATKRPQDPVKRSTVLVLSDLHLGADLSVLDEPVPFGAWEEARRLEFIMREAIDYKIRYRDTTELVLCINGDVIEGQLQHQIGAGAPLTEQKMIFWMYFRQMLAEFSAAFPSVRVFCQPGNHGRDKVRHPGRATWRKWDGHETELYQALRMMCSGLQNVTWDIPFQAVSSIDLHGEYVLMTHGDTEVKLGSPDAAARRNRAELDRINATNIYGHRFVGLIAGHYHSGRYHPGNPAMLYNPALLPPNGYARGEGWIGEANGAWMFESVPGYPIGDLRLIHVDERTDADTSLGTIIKPFRFSGV